MSNRTDGMGLDVSELVEMARRCRINIVRMTHEAGAGHPGGSLSAIDLLVALYGTELSIDTVSYTHLTLPTILLV